MIFMIAGAVQFVIGVLFLIAPAKKPSSFYGYVSYLARVTDEGFVLAQKWARNALLVTGTLEIAAGAAIRALHWEGFFIIWLILAVLLFLPMFTYTESKLKQYLTAHDAMPTDYVDPDEALKARSAHRYRQGYRDQRK
ncbi:MULTISPECIES: SdpI family protein [Lacticaseibacillus]|uniref:SdpI family protein n=2 Tax=Lacticaseibacillus TaxID=2759736 RepID=A0ABW4CLB8_9LACO|nr:MULTISPECIES: SdpI family protein [Lacticaseibacillus]